MSTLKGEYESVFLSVAHSSSSAACLMKLAFQQSVC